MLLLRKAIPLLILFLALAFNYSFAQRVSLEFSPGRADEIPASFSMNPNFSSQKGSFWVKVIITSESTNDVVLRSGNWYIQDVTFYNQKGEYIFTGNHHEVTLVKGRNIFFLHYPFIDDKDKNRVTISVSSLQDFMKEKFTMLSWQYIFTSILGLLFLLSAIYSIIIRSTDKIYIHYAYYLLTILIFFSYQYGILGNTISIIKKIPPGWFWIFSDFITITYLYFSQSFLDMKKSDPFLFKLFNVGKYIVGSMVVIETISYLSNFDLLHAVWFKGPILAFEMLVFPFIFYRVYRQKTTLSWLFLVSTIILGCANLAGQIASTLKAVSETNYFIQSGMLVDAFLFSIGIGIRFGISNKEKQQFQQDLISQLEINAKIKDRNAVELESKVKERTEALNRRNQENELLVKEIHHRVKNNMQVISSMLNIAGKKIEDSITRQPFLDSTNRINSMGLIHSFLYQNEDYPNVNTKKYIRQLTQILSTTFNEESAKVEFQDDVDERVKLDMDSAINVGLIINELATNSIKHGKYPGYNPQIRITLYRCDEKVHLVVKDNGETNNADHCNISSNFGLKLVTALAKKLNGNVQIMAQNGFEVKVVF